MGAPTLKNTYTYTANLANYKAKWLALDNTNNTVYLLMQDDYSTPNTTIRPGTIYKHAQSDLSLLSTTTYSVGTDYTPVSFIEYYPTDGHLYAAINYFGNTAHTGVQTWNLVKYDVSTNPMTLLSTGGFPVDYSTTVNSVYQTPANRIMKAVSSYLDATNGYYYIGIGSVTGSRLSAAGMIVQIKLSDGTINTISVPSNDLSGTGPWIPFIRSIVVDEVNNWVFAVDDINEAVYKFNGATRAQIGTYVDMNSHLISSLTSIIVDTTGGFLYVTDFGSTHKISVGDASNFSNSNYVGVVTPAPITGLGTRQDNSLRYQMGLTSSNLYYQFTNNSSNGFLEKLSTGTFTSDSQLQNYTNPPAAGLYRTNSVKVNAAGGIGFYSIWTSDATVSSTLNSFNINEGSPPVVGSFSPNPAYVGESVLATGSAMSGITGITVGGVAVTTFFSIDPTFLRFTIPAGVSNGSQPVVVTGSGGTSSPTNITIVNPPVPTFDHFTSTTVVRGGNTTAVGTFYTTTSSVTVGGVSASFSVIDDSNLQITIPSGAPLGSNAVVITTQGGSVTTSQNLTVNATPPSISSFSPNPTGPGQNTTVTGSGFSGTTGVTVNGTPATFNVTNDTTLIVTIPPTTIGSKPVVVTNTAGSSTPNNITIVANPVVNSYTVPALGLGSTTNAIGNGFTGTTSVTVGGVTASYSVINDSTLQITIPGGAPIGVDTVVITTPGGTTSSSIAVISTPSVTGFTPTTAGPGQVVVATGLSFAGTTNVTVDGTAASFVVNSNNTLQFIIPPGTTLGTGSVVITNPIGSSTTSFSVVPTITSIQNFTSGQAVGVPNELILINGAGFTGTTGVTVGGAPALFDVVSDSVVQVTLPDNTNFGSLVVTVTVSTGSVSIRLLVLPSSGINPAGPYPIGVFKVNLQIPPENSAGIPATRTSFFPNFGDDNYVKYNKTYITAQGSAATYLKNTYVTGALDDLLYLVAYI